MGSVASDRVVTEVIEEVVIGEVIEGGGGGRGRGRGGGEEEDDETTVAMVDVVTAVIAVHD